MKNTDSLYFCVYATCFNRFLFNTEGRFVSKTAVWMNIPAAAAWENPLAAAARKLSLIYLLNKILYFRRFVGCNCHEIISSIADPVHICSLHHHAKTTKKQKSAIQKDADCKLRQDKHLPCFYSDPSPFQTGRLYRFPHNPESVIRCGPDSIAYAVGNRARRHFYSIQLMTDCQFTSMTNTEAGKSLSTMISNPQHQSNREPSERGPNPAIIVADFCL